MFTVDFMLFFTILLQPMLLGALLFVVSKLRLFGFLSVLVRVLGPRLRLRGGRFFECAAYPRLHGSVRYQTQTLALCGVFLIYDLDLLFFFPEVTRLGSWTSWQFFLFLFWFFFFFAGIYYDLWRYGLVWSV